MADKYIQLNKPLFDDKGPPPSGGQQARPAPQPRVVPTFGGFWLRFLALMFDLLVVVMIHNVLVAIGMEETFFAISSWMPVLGALALLVMFVVVPLKVFPGQTVGKKLLRLRVVTPEFEQPPVIAYIKRFVVIFATFIIQWVAMGPQAIGDIFAANPTLVGLVMGIAVSLYLAQMSLFIMGSFKRSLHDIWANTYVVRLDSADPVPINAIAVADDITVSRNTRARRMALIMIPALTALFTFQVHKKGTSEVEVRRREFTTQLEELLGTNVGIITQVPPIPRPEHWNFKISIPNFLDLPWDEVAESEEYQSLLTQAIDFVETEFDMEEFGQTRLNELTFIGSSGVVLENYIFIPSALITSPLAAGQRGHFWQRQILPLPLMAGPEGEDPDPGNCLLIGTPITGAVPSTELIAMALADYEAALASAEAVAAAASPEAVVELASGEMTAAPASL